MYLIHVWDDGDIELMQAEQEPLDNQDLVLYTVEDVARELKDYGVDEDRINEALTRVSEVSELSWVYV